MIHVAVAILVLILHLIYEKSNNELTKKHLWRLSCCLVLFVIGFRSVYTGSDTVGYVRRFLSLKSFSFTDISKMDYRDIGFYYLVKTISLFTSSPTVFLMVTSALSLIGVFVTARRYSENPILVLFFYITLGNYLFLFTGIRQSIAMSFCLLSLPFIEKRKLISFVLIVWLASLQHHSALIFLPSYYIACRKICANNLIITAFITIIAYIFYERLLDIANEIMGYDYEVEEIDNGLIFYMILIVIIAYGYLKKDLWINDDKQVITMNLGIICAMIWTFRLIGRTAERPSMYWLNLIPIVLTNSIKSKPGEMPSENDQLIRVFAVLLSLALFFRRASGMQYALFN